MNIIRSWKVMSPAEQADTALHPGKHWKQVTGSWIDDLVANKIAIWLCSLCERKWRPAKAGYVSRRSIPYVRGKCDGCQDTYGQMRLFVTTPRSLSRGRPAMDFAYNLTASIGTPIVKKYQIGNSTAFANNPGVPGLAPAANAGGVGIATTTSLARAIGVTLDTNTYTTTQGSGTSSAQRLCSFIVNPDAVFKAKLSGGATENTALSLYPVTTASTGGTAITTGTTWTGTEFDEGVAWFFDGANVGQIRKITSTSSTAGTVTIPFDYATVVGDNAMRAPFWPGQTITLQLTTNLYQVDASIAVGTGGAATVVDADLRDQTQNGRNNSFVYFLLGDHAYREKA